MALRLLPSEPIAAGAQRIAVERLDNALERMAALSQVDGDAFDRNVHEIRKRCKEVRGMLQLLRLALGKDFARANEAVGAAARHLAVARDAQVQATTAVDLQAVLDPDGAAAVVLDELAAQRSTEAAMAAHAARSDQSVTVEATAQLLRARQIVAELDLARSRGDKLVAASLAATYRRGRRRHRRAVAEAAAVAEVASVSGDGGGSTETAEAESLHRWRRSVKQLWYQLRVLEPAAPSVLGPLVGELDQLGEALGIDHDLAVLIETLEAKEDAAAVPGLSDAIAAARARQHELRAAALRRGHTLYAERPAELASRVRRYWLATQRHGVELAYPTGRELAGNGSAGTGDAGGPAAGRNGLARPAKPAEAPKPATTRQPDLAGTVEYERRFLVAPELDLGDSTGKRIMQGYLSVGEDVSVRLREDGAGRRRLTIKGGSGVARTEVELDLDRDTFDALWPHARARRVDKVRHTWDLGAYTCEIDVFEGPLDGLRMVEVEMDSREELAAFVPPPWFGPEVTDDGRFTNAQLACSGRPPPLAVSADRKGAAR